MNRTLEIRSAHDGMLMTLSNFVAEDNSSDAYSFLVVIQSYEVRAQAKVSSYRAPDLAKYFEDIASNWRGWRGEKCWSTLEGEFALAAKSDSTGHVRLSFTLQPSFGDFHWELRGALELEAGQLPGIAESAAVLWRT
jgi:Family of unknown function (DUF6228)